MVEFIPIDLALWITVLALSIAVLVKASDYFTDSAEKVGLSLGLPSFLVGVTIIAVGTSLPELISSIIAVLRGSSEIVIGNIVGSNITNIFLVLGIAAVIGKGLKTRYEVLRVDIPFFVGSALFLAAVVLDGEVNFYEAILLLLVFAVYISYAVYTQKIHRFSRNINGPSERKIDTKTILIILISIVFIYLGARYTVESVIELSAIVGIGKEIIAASAVALGTSLPELAVTLRAASRGKLEIAMGNVLGSNIFNATIVMGIPALIGTLVIPQSIIIFALPVMIGATFLYVFTAIDREVTRWEGALFLIFYIFFISKIFNWF